MSESAVEKLADIIGVAEAIVDTYMSELSSMEAELRELALDARGKLRCVAADEHEFRVAKFKGGVGGLSFDGEPLDQRPDLFFVAYQEYLRVTRLVYRALQLSREARELERALRVVDRAIVIAGGSQLVGDADTVERLRRGRSVIAERLAAVRAELERIERELCGGV